MNRVAALALCTLLLGAAVTIRLAGIGTFALAGSTSHVQSQMVASGLDSPLAWDMEFIEAHTGGRLAIDRYDPNPAAPMELFVVDDNLRTLIHERPTLDAGGTFRQHLRFPKQGYYHIYTDTLPHGAGRQVFRFDFVAGSLSERPVRSVGTAQTGTSAVTAAPYRVTFRIPVLHARTASTIPFEISKNGAAAADIDLTDAGTARAIMIDAQSLAYLPIRIAAAPAALRFTPIKPGLHKIWLQFTDSSGATCVAPLLVKVMR